MAAVLVGLGRSGTLFGGPHLARLRVSGLITEDRALTRAVERLADDPSVKALIVSIDSPGGSVAGGESLHDAIASVAEKKPVVAVMGGLAASAGYMIAVPANRIFARQATLTGSIGVLLETGDISGLLSKIGVSTDTIVSGPLKGQPSYTRPLSEKGREMLQGLVMDMFGQFVDMVAKGRHMDVAKVKALADGRPYTGQQAVQLGLVDAIGGERDARAWLASAKGISATLPVRDVNTSGLAERALSGSLGPIVDGIWKTLISQSLRVDGAWAVWQRPG